MPQEPVPILENRGNLTQMKANISRLIDYDRGLKRETVFNHYGKEVKEGKVLMKNRNAVIADAIEYIDNNPKGKINFLMFDLANMYFANIAGAGDLVIARAANELNQVIGDFMKQEETVSQDIAIESGRYGGDEFVVSLRGETLSGEMARKLSKYIDDRFKKDKVLGYFQRGISASDSIVEQPLSIKERDNGDNVEVIETPEDEINKDIFNKFLRRGILLNKEQILKNKLAGFSDLGEYVRDMSYPKEAVTIKQKLEYIAERFPILGLEMKSLIEDSSFTDMQREEILGYVERRLIDNLLGTKISSLTEISQNMSAYSRMICIDLKFIKEMNEIYSYAESDSNIYSLYQKIRTFIPEEMQKYIDIGRRGGTFVIGFKRNLLLMSHRKREEMTKIFEDIKGLKEISIQLRGKEVNIPLGSSSLEVSKAINTRKGQGLRAKMNFISSDFGDLLSNTELEFNKQLINYLADKDNLRNIFADRLLESSIFPFKSLMIEYFTGKRSLQRSAIMLKILTSDNQYQGKEYNEVRLVMNSIYDYMKKVMDRYQDKKYDQNELFRDINQVFKRSY